MRRIREAQDEERRQVEAEVNALNVVCEQRMRANDNLTRELHQMAEDDELIRARLDRQGRISQLKDRNEAQLY